MLKLVTAVIKGTRLDAVTAALADKGIGGLTVTDVLGYGNQGGRKEVYRGREYTENFLPKSKIEVIVPADAVEDIIETIVQAARTGAGEIGDGKVWASELTGLVRVRTGEHGTDAL